MNRRRHLSAAVLSINKPNSEVCKKELSSSPFAIDFGGMYGKIARFHKAQRRENASPFRSPPGNPAGFQEIGLSHQKRGFFDGLNRRRHLSAAVLP